MTADGASEVPDWPTSGLSALSLLRKKKKSNYNTNKNSIYILLILIIN